MNHEKIEIRDAASGVTIIAEFADGIPDGTVAKLIPCFRALSEQALHQKPQSPAHQPPVHSEPTSMTMDSEPFDKIQGGLILSDG